jgi:hypothetical protein
MLNGLEPRFLCEFVESFATLDATQRYELVRWVPLALTFDEDEAAQRPSIAAAWAGVERLDPLFARWDALYGWHDDGDHFVTLQLLEDVRAGLVHIAGRCVGQLFCAWCHAEHEADAYLVDMIGAT